MNTLSQHIQTCVNERNKTFQPEHFKTGGWEMAVGFVVRWDLLFPPFLIFSLQIQMAAIDPDSSSFRLDTPSGNHSKSSN
jgi:hypothetical protein